MSKQNIRGTAADAAGPNNNNLMMHHTAPPPSPVPVRGPVSSAAVASSVSSPTRTHPEEGTRQGAAKQEEDGGAGNGKEGADMFDWRTTGTVVAAEWFAPQERGEIVGNQRAIDEFDRWAQKWRRANSAKTKQDFTLRLPERCCAFVRGPPGVGKCIAADLLLRKHGYTDIVHIDAGAMHTKQLINDRLIPLLLNANSRRAIIVDEVDGLHYTGGSSANTSDALLRFLSHDAHKVTWGETLKQRTMARGGLARFAPFYDDVSETRLKQGKSGCVTACPVVFIASDHQYQFVFKSLERACGTHANAWPSAYFLFRPVRTEDIERRYAQLAERYNFYTRAKNVKDGKADWLLLHDLATVAGGDMRKAVAMLVATVRRAYADKQERQCRGKEDDCVEKRLVLRRRHCEALLRSQLTVQTSPYQACSFLLHDCSSVHVALEHIARFRMNNVPDMLFGGFHKITPVGKNLAGSEVRRLVRGKESVRDVENRHALAGLVRLADTADAFSRANVYRQRFDYVRNESTQQVYHDTITMWSLLLLNPDQGGDGYVFGDGQLGLVQKRTFCTNFSNCRRKDCNCRWMQKSSLEAQRGQRAQWQRMGIEERNQYDQKTGQTMQTSAERFLYFRNYVNSVQQVRAKGQQLASMDDQALAEQHAPPPPPAPVTSASPGGGDRGGGVPKPKQKRQKKADVAAKEAAKETAAAKRRRITATSLPSASLGVKSGHKSVKSDVKHVAGDARKKARRSSLVIDSDSDDETDTDTDTASSDDEAVSGSSAVPKGPRTPQTRTGGATRRRSATQTSVTRFLSNGGR